MIHPSASGENSASATDIGMFNARSIAIQRATGVDPTQCISIAIAAPEDAQADGRTRLRPFLASLSRDGAFLTSPGGTWRDHDESLHFRRVRELHPEIASVIIEASDVGVERLDAGDEEAAGRIGMNIDFITARYPELWSHALYKLVLATAVEWVPGAVQEARHMANWLLELQEGHATRIEAAAAQHGEAHLLSAEHPAFAAGISDISAN